MSSATPASRTAATVSPPAMMEVAPEADRARATDTVPLWNGSRSNSPSGPFQSARATFASLSANRAAVFGPISSPIRSPGMPASGVTAGSPAPMSPAATWSTGSRNGTLHRSASSMISLATAMESLSSKDRPMATPRALRNVYAMAPPTMIRSTRGIRFLRIPILSETLAPPQNGGHGVLRCAQDSRQVFDLLAEQETCPFFPEVFDHAGGRRGEPDGPHRRRH